MSTLSLDTCVAANRDVLARQIEQDTVLLSMDSAQYFGLNPTGSRLWELLQHPRRVGDIAKAMAEEYEVEPSRVEADVIAVVRELLSEGLAKIVDEPGNR